MEITLTCCAPPYGERVDTQLQIVLQSAPTFVLAKMAIEMYGGEFDVRIVLPKEESEEDIRVNEEEAEQSMEQVSLSPPHTQTSSGDALNEPQTSSVNASGTELSKVSLSPAVPEPDDEQLVTFTNTIKSTVRELVFEVVNNGDTTVPFEVRCDHLQAQDGVFVTPYTRITFTPQVFISQPHSRDTVTLQVSVGLHSVVVQLVEMSHFVNRQKRSV